jgi:hypothetical protein
VELQHHILFIGKRRIYTDYS